MFIPNLQTKGSDAIVVYRQAIARAEPSAEVYYMLGMIMLYDPLDNRVFSTVEKEAAIEAFRKATQIKSQNTTYVAASYVVLGDRFLQGQAQIDAYQAAINLNYLGGYMSYANLLERQNRLSEIVPLYQQAIQQNPNAPNIIGLHVSLGNALMKLKQWNEAEGIYRKLRKIDPNDIYTHFSLGDVLKNQGKSDEALRLYKQAAERVRPDSLASPGSIFSYEQVGNYLRDF
jgi:protein O-GlcNAc transferase